MSTSSMHVAKTGLNAQQTRMQIIANNLANVNTTGFKRDRANFETLLYQVRRTAGDQVTAEAISLHLLGWHWCANRQHPEGAHTGQSDYH